MKIVIETNSDSDIVDQIEAAAAKAAKAKKLKPGTEEYDKAFSKEAARLTKLVGGYVNSFVEGSVRLEFDDEAKTVRVMRARK